MKTLLSAIASLLLFAGAAAAQDQDIVCPSPPEDDPIDFGERVELSVIAGDATHAFQTLIADEPAEHARGMMFRPSMGDEEAMFFDFSEEGPDRVHRFWMRNTCVSLDIIYIRADGVVVGVVELAQPLAEILLPSPGPVRAVLEVRGGRTAELGIEPGAIVRHPAFDATESEE